jgi:head-tail adaptor
MNAGQLNRRITIQEAQTTISNTGATSKSWVSYLSLFANMKEDSGAGTESSRSDVLTPVHRVLWTIRWSAAANAITPQMRLSYGGEYYQIMSVQNVGIKEYIQIITEMRGSGSGAAPVACDPATYSNGGAFTQEIAAGGAFTADPITVTDVNGVGRSSLPNIAVVCAWIALSVRNSQGTVIQSVASYPSGGNIVIPDQTTRIGASDDGVLETIDLPLGASVNLTDFEVTAPSYAVTIAARRKIKILGSVPTSTEIDGEFIEITMPSGGICDDATYSNGGAFTQAIPSGDTYTAPNIIVTDVNGIQRSVLPNINITALWATLTTKNTLGDSLSTVASYPTLGNVVIPDQSIDILASDDYVLKSLTQVVGADVTANDIEVTDGGAFTQEFAARGGIRIVGSTITSTAIDGDYIEITVPTGVTGIVYQRPQWGGQITSYADGDVGYSAANGAYNYNETGDVSACLDYTALDPFYTLKFNNAFGNKYRFTTDNGTPASDGKADFILSDFSTATETYYVIDHLTGLGYMQGKVGVTINWASAMAACNAYSNTYTGWRAISDGEINSVINDNTFYYGSGNIFKRDVMITTLETQMWLGNTDLIVSTNNAFRFNNSGDIARASKTSTGNYGVYVVRNHY